MPDYKEMYLSLFRSMTKAIDILQEAQRSGEEMFMSSEETKVIDIKKNGESEK